MITLTSRYFTATAAAVAVSLFAFGAQAQEKKVDPKAPVTKTEKKAMPPACNSLKVQTGCEARTDCNWVAEAKNDKGKVTKKAYCRANPGTAKKK